MCFGGVWVALGIICAQKSRRNARHVNQSALDIPPNALNTTKNVSDAFNSNTAPGVLTVLRLERKKSQNARRRRLHTDPPRLRRRARIPGKLNYRAVSQNTHTTKWNLKRKRARLRTRSPHGPPAAPQARADPADFALTTGKLNYRSVSPPRVRSAEQAFL